MWGRKRPIRSDEEYNPNTGEYERPESRKPKQRHNSTRRIFDDLDDAFG